MSELKDLKKVGFFLLIFVLLLVVTHFYEKPRDQNSQLKKNDSTEVLSSEEARKVVRDFGSSIDRNIAVIEYSTSILDTILAKQRPGIPKYKIDQLFSDVEDISVTEHKKDIKQITHSLASEEIKSINADTFSSSLDEVDQLVTQKLMYRLNNDTRRALELLEEINSSITLSGLVVKEIVSVTDKSSYEIFEYGAARPAILTTRVGRFSGPESFRLSVHHKNDVTMKLKTEFTANVPVYIEYPLAQKNAELTALLAKLIDYHKSLREVHRHFITIGDGLQRLDSVIELKATMPLEEK